MLVSYVKKQLAPAVLPLKSVAEVLAFVDDSSSSHDPTSNGDDGSSKASSVDIHAAKGATRVVGFFSDKESMEEDEYNEFMEAVKSLQSRFDVIVGVVTDEDVVTAFKGPARKAEKYDWIDRSPSLVVQRLGIRRCVNVCVLVYVCVLQYYNNLLLCCLILQIELIHFLNILF
jgi:hypothetical protein